MTPRTEVMSRGECRLAPLAVAAHDELRRRMMFEGAKWDPQVGDIEVVGRQTLVLERELAAALEANAEALAREVLALERALLGRPDLHRALGMPRALRSPLRDAANRRGAGDLRVMRFDFHRTARGWVVSEVNSDVPGGFAEAGAMARIAAEVTDAGVPGPDPATLLAAGLAQRLAAQSRVALVHATGFSDDRQVMEYIATALTKAGLRSTLIAPDHLRWHGGVPRSIANGGEGPIDALIRFYPAEWLPALPRECAWPELCTSEVIQCNPPSAALVQSKRAPLVAEAAGVAMPTWRACVAESRAPGLLRSGDEGWVLKSAWGRVGEGVALRGCVAPGALTRMRLSAAFAPRSWVLQRLFESEALESSDGPVHICIGVFVIDGKAAGFYGRGARAPLIDKHAVDLAVLHG